MATDRDDILGSIERLLVEVVREHPNARRSIGEVRRLLKTLGPTLKSPGKRQVSETTGYSVSGVGVEASLAEQRPFAQPLRVSRRVFDGIVDVLVRAERPLPFDEVMIEAVKGDNPPAEWQARVVLRFLTRARPTILLRERSRYRAADPEKFRAAANKWWTATAELR